MLTRQFFANLGLAILIAIAIFSFAIALALLPGVFLARKRARRYEAAWPFAVAVVAIDHLNITHPGASGDNGLSAVYRAAYRRGIDNEHIAHNLHEAAMTLATRAGALRRQDREADAAVIAANLVDEAVAALNALTPDMRLYIDHNDTDPIQHSDGHTR